jgi:high affinity Mn2+ porin
MNKWIFLLLGLMFALAAAGEEPVSQSLPDSNWGIHGDATLIDQKHGAFTSLRPDGQNSFSSRAENSYSTVIGINGGYRLGDDTEFWARLETIRGIPLSDAGGLAALANNDMQRVMENRFVSYIAQAYLRHTWNIGGEVQLTEGDAMAFPRYSTPRNFVVSAGKIDLLSLYDGNDYAQKNDTQFLNWCFMTSCAYDFAADARGYTWGVNTELNWDDWSVRSGWFAMPRLPNQLEIDASILQHFGVNAEVERRWKTGSLKFLIYQGRMKLTDYTQYLNPLNPVTNLLNTPKADEKRGGAGLNLQQAITDQLGFFARAFWDGGHYETMAFTEADSSQSVGLSLKGTLWHRAEDSIGLGLARNQINSVRQRYLAAGNMDLFIGDGYLHYGQESLVEAYYSLGLRQNLYLTFDWQRLDNPAYNQDRGPVNIYGLRLHGEF